MEIDKVFSSDVDGVADNLFSAVKNSVSEIKAMQQRKAAENVQLVIQALKKIESDLQDKFDGVTTVIEKRVAAIKDGRDGLDGRNGRDGKDGRPGRDGTPGARGPAGVPGTNGRDGEDGVSVTDAKIDFDGSLIISLSSGREINVGEVVAPDLAEKIKVITNGGGTSQSVLDTLASLQAQITAISNFGYVNYVGTWNANTNSPTITSGSGDKGDYYVVSVAGFTNIDGQTLWGVGDWIIFNGSVWQKVDGGSTGDFTNISVNTMATFTYLDDDKAVFTNSSAELVSKAVTGTGNVVLSASPTLTGTASLAALTTSSTVTHNGGTANGVAYLNGSKVLTTGSALTFDTARLSFIKASNGRAWSADGDDLFAIENSTSANADFRTSTTGATYLMFSDTDARARGYVAYLHGSDSMPFAAAGSEQMRLTSTGLGVGQSNPAAKLDVNSTAAAVMRLTRNGGTAANTALQYFNGTNSWYAGMSASGLYSIGYNDAALDSGQLRLDSSGNLGLGVTPSAWESTAKAFQFGSLGYVARGSSGQTMLGYNNYLNTSNQYIYSATSQASRYEQISGEHRWFTAASGTAGNAISFTQAMTLDASGNLGIGTTSPSYKLDVAGSTSTARLGKLTITNDAPFITGANIDAGSNSFALGTSGAAPAMFFTANTERARIDSSGNLLVGTTSSDGSRLRVYGSYQTLGDGAYEGLIGKASSLVSGGGSGDFAIRSAASLVFATNGNTERARIDSSGNLGVGCVPGSIWPSATSSSGDNGSTFRKTYISISSNASILEYLNRNDGDGTITQYYRTGTAVGSVSVTSTATAYNTSSDYRLKNITGPVTNSGAYIDSLNPVEGTWKADGSTFVGLIAHEVQEASRTQVATGTKDGEEMQGMDYSNSEIIANLIAELQSLRRRVAQLEGK